MKFVFQSVPGVALRRRCWFFAALCLLTFPALATPPAQVEAVYRLTKGAQPFGIAEESYRREGNTYRITSVTRATGIFALFVKGAIRLESRGEVGAAGLRPTHFEHWRGNDAQRAIFADFDWRKGEVTLRYDGKNESEALPGGCQDRLSQLYQFMHQPPRGEFDMAMSSGRQVGHYRYRVAGEETLDTPAGRFDALRLEKLGAGKGDGVEIWLAKNRAYLPVKVRYEEKDGSFLEQVVEKLNSSE